MTVYLAWTSHEVPDDVPGPWRELRPVARGLVLVDSPDSLSRVYHELKWALPDGTALLVTAVDSRPKLKGLPAGTQSWLRERVPKE